MLIKGAFYDDITAIQAAVTEELKNIYIKNIKNSAIVGIHRV